MRGVSTARPLSRRFGSCELSRVAPHVSDRLREAGMSIEASQAQAGHASIETTRVYVHVTNDWLGAEYRRATDAIDAQHRRAVR